MLPPREIGRRLGSSGTEVAFYAAAEVTTASLAVVLSVIPVIGTLVGAAIGMFVSLLGAVYFGARDMRSGRFAVGKRLADNEVVDVATGAPASNVQGFVRNSYLALACVIAIIPGVEVIGWALFAVASAVDVGLIYLDPTGRRLGDHLAGTQVRPRD